MSSHFISIIPHDPVFIPDAQAQVQAKRLLQRFAPRAEAIAIQVSDSPVFVDPGSNFGTVRCPRCRAEIITWWLEAMDRAAAQQFSNLAVETLCCAAASSLNDLRYDWPCGFARFIIKVQNPNIGLFSVLQIRELGRTLACRVRQILGHV